MKRLLLLVATLSLGACSSGRSDDGAAPSPATVTMDSSGVVVDTTTAK